jgi:hypothetical protein
MAMVGLCGAEPLLSGRELGPGSLNLRLCGQVFGFGVIQFLLRDQPRMCIRGLLETIERRVQSCIIGYRSRNCAPSAQDILLAALHHGLRPFNLRGHFRDLKLGQQLPGMDAITDVDIDFADIPGDLGMNLHFLKGEELSCHFKPI